MTWGFFSIVHIISLLISVGIIVGLYFILKNKSDKVKVITLGILSFTGLGAIVFNLLKWDSPLEYLPFHLCSLNAMVLPFAVFTKNKVLNNLILLWALGAVFALLVNTAQADYEILSWTFVFYYFPHTLEIGIPILMFALKLVRKDFKCIFTTLGITLVAYIIIHFINLGVNSYALKNNIVDWQGEVIKVNYMYSLVPENPMLELFYSIIPHKFWYMLLVFPIVFVYLAGIYFNDIRNYFKNKKVNA